MHGIQLKLIKFAFAYEMNSFNTSSLAQNYPSPSLSILFLAIKYFNEKPINAAERAYRDDAACRCWSLLCPKHSKQAEPPRILLRLCAAAYLKMYVNVRILCELPSNYFLTVCTPFRLHITAAWLTLALATNF